MNKISLKKKKRVKRTGNSLAVQWLGFTAFTAEGLGQSLVGELDPTSHVVPPEKRSEKNQQVTDLD